MQLRLLIALPFPYSSHAEAGLHACSLYPRIGSRASDSVRIPLAQFLLCSFSRWRLATPGGQCARGGRPAQTRKKKPTREDFSQAALGRSGS